MGKLSRDLKKLLRNTDPRNLIAYIEMCTGRHFDTEIAYLLGAAYKAAGTDKCFTADQIKKFRQRHVARSGSAQHNEARGLPTLGQMISARNKFPVDGEPKRRTSR